MVRRVFMAALVGLALALLAFGRPTGGSADQYSVTFGARRGEVAELSQADESAIQQVIQRGNDEQAQAISSRDAAAMADTSTADYYRQLAEANRQLLEHGVTGIKLVKLAWGPIDGDGATATATTTETWRTNYQDGTSDVSRDTNVYSLVNSGGIWRIQSDRHGDDRVAEPPAPSAPAPRPPTPFVPRSGSTSRNWAGYVAAGGARYTSVSGSWIVPELTPGRTFGASAAWVGIGGALSHDLIQAGTQEMMAPSGRSRYEAWIETLPQPSHAVSLAVSPGDAVTVSIGEQQPDTWVIAFTNHTTGETYQQTQTYASSHSSADWVEEAPSSSRMSLLPLGNFGSLPFTEAWTIKDDETVNISEARARPITMVDETGRSLAVPSGIGDDDASFTVDRIVTAADS